MDRARASDLLVRYVEGGALKVIPAKRNAKLVVFEWLARRFELERRYSEKEVNLLIGQAHPDFATLRRGLYDERFVNREGGFYWRTPDEQKLVLL